MAVPLAVLVVRERFQVGQGDDVAAVGAEALLVEAALALLQLALQLLPLDGVQLGGPCGERVRDTSFSGETGDNMWSTVIRVFRSVSLGAVLTQTNVIYYLFLFTAL